MSMAEEQNNLAVLYVDVIDSRRPRESPGDAAPLPEAQECIDVVLQVAAGHAGHAIKSIRDGVMCAFPDADSAVVAACEIQELVHQKNQVQARRISIRIGLHFGPALIVGVTAERMALFATSGQIITTAETNALLPEEVRNATRPHVLPARKKDGTVTVYEVMWHKDGDQTRSPAPQVSGTQPAGAARLRLLFGGREIQVLMSVNIGRRADHGIALTDARVSRDHAFIVHRPDGFVLVDQSRNGTFVCLENGKEYRLRQKEMVLHGSGVITFGRRAHETGAEIVSFWCESNGTAKEPPR
jgi:class 3 adenylate cyclase